MKFISPARFAWLVEFRNTVKELRATFNAPTAIARELQSMIARGADVEQCNQFAAASYELRAQSGN